MVYKTCSVFRGNIGAEFDAMLDALAQAVAHVKQQVQVVGTDAATVKVEGVSQDHEK